MLSAVMMNASPLHFRSLASTKSDAMRWPHCALCGAALRLGVGVGAAVGDAAAAGGEALGCGDASEAGRGTAQAAVVTRSSATPAALTRISKAYTTASRRGSRDTALVR